MSEASRWRYAELDFSCLQIYRLHGAWTTWRDAREALGSEQMQPGDLGIGWHARFKDANGAATWGVSPDYNPIPFLERAGRAGWEVMTRGEQLYSDESEVKEIISYLLRRYADVPPVEFSPELSKPIEDILTPDPELDDEFGGLRHDPVVFRELYAEPYQLGRDELEQRIHRYGGPEPPGNR